MGLYSRGKLSKMSGCVSTISFGASSSILVPGPRPCTATISGCGSALILLSLSASRILHGVLVEAVLGSKTFLPSCIIRIGV